MASQWHFKKATTQERFGPFSDAELKQQAAGGFLEPDDLIWREGMKAPAAASKLPGLFLPLPVPPPLPSLEMAPPDPFDTAAVAADTVSFIGGSAPPLLEEEIELGLSPEGIWREKSFLDDYPLWRLFWKAVDCLGSRYRAVYLVLPWLLAVPVGFFCGLFNVFNPILIITVIALFIIGILLGLIVFEGFRRSGIHQKMLSMIGGFGVGCVAVYFFFVGGFSVERESMDYEKPIGFFQVLLPHRVAEYVHWKSGAMVVGKIYERDRRPDRIGNYFWIGLDVLTLLLSVTSGAGGGRETKPGKNDESDMDAPYIALLNKK